MHEKFIDFPVGARFPRPSTVRSSRQRQNKLRVRQSSQYANKYHKQRRHHSKPSIRQRHPPGSSPTVRVFNNDEKVNIVRRVLLGLEAVGVERVFFMPDSFSIGPKALDGLENQARCFYPDHVENVQSKRLNAGSDAHGRKKGSAASSLWAETAPTAR